MAEYQVLARRYRPQIFAEVFGQEAIVTTLKNAILHRRLAHAYLFCGSRGTGKTTLARVFAKALNCQTARQDLEPCNHCASCKEITNGSSLDVLEIDGASHRGIDDIRQINDTVGYSSATGGYKIYIIDEVHMLTKEAFNALLKTLEEPPERVKFFFATTEPHKVPTTILSRCQRFNLNRIPIEKIFTKLKYITDQQKVEISEEALYTIAKRAEGGMRDAESLLDQILAFHEGSVTADSVADVLGIVPRELFFTLDQAVKETNLAIAFEIAHQVFSQGKDLLHFVESLTEHFRTILLVKIADQNAPFFTLSASDLQKYTQSSKVYTQEQCLTILDFLIESLNQIRYMPSGRIALEALLLRILRIQQRIPVDFLVRQLHELEQSIGKNSNSLLQLQSQPATTPLHSLHQATEPPIEQPLPTPEPTQIPIPSPTPVPPPSPSPIPSPSPQIPPTEPTPPITPTPTPVPPAPTPPTEPPIGPPIISAINYVSPVIEAATISITIDPSPSIRDLGIKKKRELSVVSKSEVSEVKETAVLKIETAGFVVEMIANEKVTSQHYSPVSASGSAPIELGSRPTPEAVILAAKKQSRYDTILHFAAIELEGSLQKTAIKGY
ncbi:MAG: DNA polymerase III subunit gamma/tau [Parachlamydiaceae bacterium]|nr:DNA polymerase III subunit gamma/tau [Parachlamydiaceae bacterium]